MVAVRVAGTAAFRVCDDFSDESALTVAIVAVTAANDCDCATTTAVRVVIIVKNASFISNGEYIASAIDNDKGGQACGFDFDCFDFDYLSGCKEEGGGK